MSLKDNSGWTWVDYANAWAIPECASCQEAPGLFVGHWQGEPVPYCGECHKYDFGDDAPKVLRNFQVTIKEVSA